VLSCSEGVRAIADWSGSSGWRESDGGSIVYSGALWWLWIENWTDTRPSRRQNTSRRVVRLRSGAKDSVVQRAHNFSSSGRRIKPWNTHVNKYIPQNCRVYLWVASPHHVILIVLSLFLGNTLKCNWEDLSENGGLPFNSVGVYRVRSVDTKSNVSIQKQKLHHSAKLCKIRGPIFLQVIFYNAYVVQTWRHVKINIISHFLDFYISWHQNKYIVGDE
jgi:hypothetical protein